MQDYQVTFHQNNQEQEISQRTHLLLDSLQDMLRRFQKLSHEHMGRILEMAVRFPEPYRAAVMNSIAEKLVSSMAIHYLDILTTFCQKAGQEDIDAEEQAAAIADNMTDLFPMITGLSTRLAVRTLDDLVKLAAITVGLYGLSHAETAEQAQHWLYALPQMYAGQLAQEHLIAAPSLQFRVTIHTTTAPTIMGLSQAMISVVPGTPQFMQHPPQLVVSSAPEVANSIESPIADSQAAIAA